MSESKFRLVDFNWAAELDCGLADCFGEIWIVSPFIKLASARRFIRRSIGSRLRIVTRFNLNDFDAGVSDIDALAELTEHGATIRGIRDLHAKVYVFGANRSIVTSANLTESGLLRNREFGIVTTETAAVEECQNYCQRLWAQGKVDLSQTMIQEWRALLKDARASRQPAALAKLPDFGQNPTVQNSSQAENAIIADSALANAAFIKFFGSGDNRALRSMSIHEEITRSGSHWACTYPKRPRQVSDGDKMFMARMVRSPDDYLIYGEATGRRHLDVDDVASDADVQKRPWKSHWPYYVRVHEPRFLNGKLVNGVSMNRLMAELGSKAFAVTMSNALKGVGNVEPRRALMQQAAVKLSPHGAEWVRRELDQAYKVYGQFDLADHALDWPN